MPAAMFLGRRSDGAPWSNRSAELKWNEVEAASPSSKNTPHGDAVDQDGVIYARSETIVSGQQKSARTTSVDFAAL